MQVVNAVMPTPDQIQSLVAAAPPGPILMLNLLKFHEHAAYEDGADATITGQEAYMRYGREVRKLVEAGGGRLIVSGRAQRMVIGELDELWDAVAIVEYASAAAFVQMAMSPAMAQIAHHRKAGLKGQLLMLCTPAPELEA